MTLNKNTFIGEYSYTLDAKGRINIPSKFRSSLSKDNDQSLVITRGMDKCIWLYPLIIWQTIENELRKLSSLSGINRTFTRNTVRYASIVQIDKQGRIALNQNIINFAIGDGIPIDNPLSAIMAPPVPIPNTQTPAKTPS